LNVAPTYINDHVESVTLKSFRKVVGYDTFNSILKGERDEKKDINDYYNVTVSMMIKRVPEVVAAAPIHDPYDGGKTLSETLDKGFPYDDGDNTTDDMVPNWKEKKGPKVASLVGKLNGENITKDALVNLVRDTDAPITQGLVQLDVEELKSDADNLSTLFDSNVTRGALKNLITDKPAPITTALAQKSDADNLSTLFDANVTRGALKNLITDKPAPITTALAQKSDGDNLSTLFDSNVTRGALKNLITDKPAPITTALAQKSDKDGLFTLMDNNVTRGAMKNLITDRPSPVTVALAQANQKKLAAALLQLEKSQTAKGVPVHVNPVIAVNTEGDTDLSLKMLVGPDEVSVAKKNAAKKPAVFAEIESDDSESELVQLKNPVNNPPYNNWSVNQPSPPH
jgi:hypothetical protein